MARASGERADRRTPSPQPLRVLFVEDNPADVSLLVAELRRSGFEPRFQRVETEEQYLAALDPALDLILADYAVPNFGAERALALLRATDLDIPFIVVSGTVGEEIAASLIRDGATDYLLKDRLTRLGQAIRHARERQKLLQ